MIWKYIFGAISLVWIYTFNHNHSISGKYDFLVYISAILIFIVFYLIGILIGIIFGFFMKKEWVTKEMELLSAKQISHPKSRVLFLYPSYDDSRIREYHFRVKTESGSQTSTAKLYSDHVNIEEIDNLQKPSVIISRSSLSGNLRKIFGISFEKWQYDFKIPSGSLN